MNKNIKREILEWIKTIGISIIIATGITIVAQPTIVSGQSMYPTLEDKDYLIVNRLAYNKNIPDRGDILVFESNLLDTNKDKAKKLVKRVIALPGERIVINNNKVWIDGNKLDEKYLDEAYTEGDIDIIVPENHIFTMGDNRECSDDSRTEYIGTISLDDIVGEVVLKVYPFNEFGVVE